MNWQWLVAIFIIGMFVVTCVNIYCKAAFVNYENTAKDEKKKPVDMPEYDN